MICELSVFVSRCLKSHFPADKDARRHHIRQATVSSSLSKESEKEMHAKAKRTRAKVTNIPVYVPFK